MSLEFTDVLTNQPVVIDNGSGIIKAGFAGAEEPSCVFPSYIGRPKHARIMAGALEGEYFIGNQASSHRGLMKLTYPIEHGIVKQWDDMERIWTHVYDQLKTPSEEHPILLTEAANNPSKHRDYAAQVLFETFNVPALFVGVQAVLALYASGRTTGVVLDSGDGVTHCVPVYEGFAIPHAIKRIDLGGRDVTRMLQFMLQRAGWPLYTSAEFDIVRQIKEEVCHCTQTHPVEYVLPDGKVVKLGKERMASEIMFKPDIYGKEFPGVHELLVDAISRVDLDLRRELYGNIILSGGNTLTKGFGDRLLSETKKLAQRDVKIKIYAPPERKYSTWIGGSILASLSTFKKMWVSAEEYQEDPDIINRKMF